MQRWGIAALRGAPAARHGPWQGGRAAAAAPAEPRAGAGCSSAPSSAEARLGPARRWGCTAAADLPFPAFFLVCVCVKEGRNKAICLGRPGTDSRKVLFLGNVKHFAGTFFPVRVRGAGLCFEQAIVALPRHPEQISPKQSISAALGAPLSLLPLLFFAQGPLGKESNVYLRGTEQGWNHLYFFNYGGFKPDPKHHQRAGAPLATFPEAAGTELGGPGAAASPGAHRGRGPVPSTLHKTPPGSPPGGHRRASFRRKKLQPGMR